NYPAADAVYAAIERLGVTKLYTAPTLARMLLRLGDEPRDKHDLTCLQAIFCAGEPLNPEAWHFLFRDVGLNDVAVCNQWWQTELAAPSIGYFPSSAIRPDKSGKAVGPLAFSVRDGAGNVVPRGQGGGLLVLENPQPYMFKTIWNDSERHKQYF